MYLVINSQLSDAIKENFKITNNTFLILIQIFNHLKFLKPITILRTT